MMNHSDNNLLDKDIRTLSIMMMGIIISTMGLFAYSGYISSEIIPSLAIGTILSIGSIGMLFLCSMIIVTIIDKV